MVDGLHLNGTWLDRQSLLALAGEKKTDTHISAWELAFWRFLAEWSSDRDVLSVQSSGSTGPPKTISIPKTSFQNSARMTLDFLRIMPGDRALLCLSPVYIAGKMMIVRALIGGLQLTTISPQVSAILNHDAAYDFSAMVPTQVQSLLRTTEGRDRIQTIGTLLIGGSPLSQDLEDQLQAFDNRIYATYGMTETASHIALRRLNGPDRSPYYQTLAGVKIRTDENDCLIIDAPALSDTTIHTRDMVRLIDDHQFEVIGRFDHIINSGGIKFSPEVIEQKLARFISDRFIISSLPDPRLGEKLILIIETENHLKYADEKLMALLKENFPVYEVPKMVFFLAKLPLLDNEKLARKTITREALKHNPDKAE